MNHLILTLAIGLFASAASAQTPARVGPLSIQNALGEIGANGTAAQAAARGNLGLGSAATLPSSSFDAAGLAASEATRATAAEAVNAASVVSETTRALTAEGTNASAVASEIVRATGAEGVNATAIGTEATARNAAVNAEATARTTAVTNETTRAAGAEATLTTSTATAQAKADAALSAASAGPLATQAGASGSAAIAAALGYTPYSAANPAGYVTAATAAVSSVAGRTGAITLSNTDIAGFATAASAAAPVQTVAGRTGSVVLGVADVSGAATAASVTSEISRATGAEGANTTAITTEATTARSAANLTSGIVPAGRLAGVDLSGANVTTAGAATALTPAALAAQQGVLLDAFKVAGDADDTASMTRAVTAGVPILLGPRTYTINNYAMAGAPASFVLKGVQGASVIKRTNGSAGSQFFAISATSVVIDGVIFDMNGSVVTASQWGVFMGVGGQNVSVTHSVFKNNAGALGSCFNLLNAASTGPTPGGAYNISDNEFSGCAGNGLYLASVAHGVVARNYSHDNTQAGIFVGAYGAASSTNYLTDLTIMENRVLRSGGTGISVGGYAPPYNFTVPPVVNVLVANNKIIDAVNYGIAIQGDYLDAQGNSVTQSAPTVTVYGGIVVNGRYAKVINNSVILANTNWGIDIGGSLQVTLRGNVVSMTQGNTLNVGGNVNSLIDANHLYLSGTALGISDESIESGGGAVLPTPSSGNTISNNIIDMVGSATAGITLSDNPGGYPGTTAETVINNHFNMSGSGNNPTQAISWLGAPSSLNIDGNTVNGTSVQFADPQVNGDTLFDLVYMGGTISGSASSANVRGLMTPLISAYGNGQSVLWTTPTAGGSGYSAATTIAYTGTGCTGQIGQPMIIGGVIMGVRMNGNFGTGCSGTVTAAAVDSGGGSGATFSVGSVPGLPKKAKLSFYANLARLFQASGGVSTLLPRIPIELSASSLITLQAPVSGTAITWTVVNAPIASFAIGSLPTCNSTSSAALITVSASVSGKWQARCNGTNWIAPDGTTIN